MGFDYFLQKKANSFTTLDNNMMTEEDRVGVPRRRLPEPAPCAHGVLVDSQSWGRGWTEDTTHLGILLTHAPSTVVHVRNAERTMAPPSRGRTPVTNKGK